MVWFQICCRVSTLQHTPAVSICRRSGQEDPSQVFALASIWILIFAFGSVAFLLPVLYTAGLAYQDVFHSELVYTQATGMSSLSMLNGTLFTVLGSIIGYPIASASEIFKTREVMGSWPH